MVFIKIYELKEPSLTVLAYKIVVQKNPELL